MNEVLTRPTRAVRAAAVGAAALACLATAPATVHAAGGSSERVIERVSPIEKSGGQAAFNNVGSVGYSRASADGNRIVYVSTAAMGDAFRGLQFYTTGTRTATGWAAKGTIPGPEHGITPSAYNHLPGKFLPSADGSRVAFTSGAPYVTDNPPSSTGDATHSLSAYLTTPTGPIEWLTRPQTDEAEPRPGQIVRPDGSAVALNMIGGSQDLSTLYFSYCGTITASDAPRAGRENLGFYVSENGQVESAATLPDGSIDPDGAQSTSGASYGCVNYDPYMNGNPVSEDGSRAMFVSPDPTAGSVRPTQLYVHRRGAPSLLASRSELTGAPAATGAMAFGTDYAYASRSGSHVVFASTDRLTSDAPVSSDPKLYRFDVETEDVRYLDGVTTVSGSSTAIPAPVTAVADDGQRVLYRHRDAGNVQHLAFWDDGEIVPVGTFDGGDGGQAFQVRLSPDGSTIALQTQHPFAGSSANHAPGTYQVYRYTFGDAVPTCISCVADGVVSIGSAYLSNWGSLGTPGMTANGTAALAPARSVSPDVGRVFFDSPDALVATDSNGKRDVYGWEDGKVGLISTGRSDRDSFLLDTSVSGDDVFFSTSEGIDPADVDDSYDVYDSRVGGGFPVVKKPAPCAGDDCQGQPGVAPVFGAAVSGLFEGSGNVVARQSVRVVGRRAARGQVVLRVRAPSKGRITVSGAGLRTKGRSVSKAATYRVAVSLTPRAVRKLSRIGSRRVRVRVRFAPAAGPSSSTTVAVTVRKKQG